MLLLTGFFDGGIFTESKVAVGSAFKTLALYSAWSWLVSVVSCPLRYEAFYKAVCNHSISR